MSEYDVGYRKPPKSNQIRKGEVRNPNGRRGKNSSLKSVVPESDSAIIARIESELINANGQEMTKRELAIRVLQAKALKGDTRAWQQLEALRAKTRASEPKQAGGVLLLPSEVPLEEWEASVAIQQAKFRERPNDYKPDDSDQD